MPLRSSPHDFLIAARDRPACDTAATLAVDALDAYAPDRPCLQQWYLALGKFAALQTNPRRLKRISNLSRELGRRRRRHQRKAMPISWANRWIGGASRSRKQPMHGRSVPRANNKRVNNDGFLSCAIETIFLPRRLVNVVSPARRYPGADSQVTDVRAARVGGALRIPPGAVDPLDDPDGWQRSVRWPRARPAGIARTQR